MRTVKEINEQIQKEQDYMAQLYTQINVINERIECLHNERMFAQKEELGTYIDNWLNEKFGIKNQIEARMKSIYIVFDKEANFIKTVICGYGEEFHYVSSAKDKDTLEYWLKQNKLYAHRASSFCDRHYAWYQMSFKEQLEFLLWDFDENGNLFKTQW